MISRKNTEAKFAIGLVLYHPDERLLKRLNQMVELGFQVYIFDNSPFGLDSPYPIQASSSVTYLTAGKNVGIGYSLATICATAHAHGFSSLLYLDQDTSISGATLKFINQYASSIFLETQHKYAALVFTGRQSKDHSIQEVRLAISSGSLFNLPSLKDMGWHSEKYFVDCVDYEFCLRARRFGYKIGRIGNTPDFDHVAEQPDTAVKIFGKQLLVRRYAPERIKGTISAYAKLIFGQIFTNELKDTYYLIKSLAVYVGAQLISRLIK